MKKEERLLLILKYGEPPPPAKEGSLGFWPYLEELTNRRMYLESLPSAFLLQNNVFLNQVILDEKFATMSVAKVLDLLAKFDNEQVAYE